MTTTPSPARKNRHLSAARSAKNDEFYTQWADIEREMNAYLEYDSDVFRDKVILLPCDDPEWSNFAKFFALHFTDFGLRKLISASVLPDGRIRTENGVEFDTLSGAADTLTGKSNNGWEFWQIERPEGVRELARIREDYLGSQDSGGPK